MIAKERPQNTAVLMHLIRMDFKQQFIQSKMKKQREKASNMPLWNGYCETVEELNISNFVLLARAPPLTPYFLQCKLYITGRFRVGYLARSVNQ